MSRKHQKKSGHSGRALSSDDQARLDALLENLSEFDLSSVSDQLGNPQFAASFVEKIPLEDSEAITLVLAVQDAFPQKEVQKAVRRILFRLKQRGVTGPERQREDSPPFVAIRLEQSQANAYVSPPDGLGNRAIFLEIKRFPAGVDLGMGVVSDEKGLLQFLFGNYSKKKAKEMMESFFQSVPYLLETSLEHAATLLESAYHISKAGPNRSVADYLKLRPWLLRKTSLLKAPIIYDLISPESLPDVPLTDSQVDKLLGHKWTETWIVHPDAIKPLIEDILNVQQSPILVSAEQKAARILDLKEAYVSKTYTDSKRSVAVARLEEIAYLLSKAGEEDYAVLALKAALSMKEKDSTFRTNDFLRHMIDHSLSYYLRSMKENPEDASGQEPGTGLILPR